MTLTKANPAVTGNTATTLQAKAQAVAGAPGPVPSPCISVCRMDPVSQLCIGCYRTLEEIMVWSRCEDAFKRQVWQAIEQRVQKDLS
jgi:predicted Fe-S protein YdhL (DUF1289 family)